MSRNQADEEDGGVFNLTQKGDGRINEMKKEIQELEQLLAGTNQTSQSTLLLKKRKEMREVDESLEVMKDAYKRRMDFCEERRLQFEAKQTKMRDNVIKFEKFIQENDAKRQRAEAKIKQERKMYDQKCQELKSTLSSIKDLKEGQDKVIEELQKYNGYAAYLQDFADRNQEMGFIEMSDIIKRYWTLKESNNSLMESIREQENQVDDYRSKLSDLLIKKENSGLVNNSLLQQQQQVLDDVRIQAKAIEQGTEIETESQKNDLRDMAEIVQGVRNLFNRCQAGTDKKAKLTLSKEATLIENLSYNIEIIHGRCRDLLEISQEYNAHNHIVSSAGDLGGVSMMTSTTSAGGVSVGSGQSKK